MLGVSGTRICGSRRLMDDRLYRQTIERQERGARSENEGRGAGGEDRTKGTSVGRVFRPGGVGISPEAVFQTAARRHGRCRSRSRLAPPGSPSAAANPRKTI